MDIIKPQIALSDISLFADHRLFMLWDVNNVFPEILLPSTSLFFLCVCTILRMEILNLTSCLVRYRLHTFPNKKSNYLQPNLLTILPGIILTDFINSQDVAYLAIIECGSVECEELCWLRWMIYCPCSLLSNQIYHRIDGIYCSHLPNMVSARWLWRISRGIGANQKRLNILNE